MIGVATKNLLPLYMPAYETVAEPAPEFLELFRNAKPDLIVSMHYPAIFKPVLLDVPPLGCVNIHPSKVPEGRGMIPSWWYLYLGRKKAWTALHYIDEGVDSGDIIAFGSMLITDEDTGATVSKRLSEAAWEIFRDNLPAIMAGTVQRQKQDLSKGNYLWAGRDWHLIKWSRSARCIRGQIRCFTDTGNNAYTFVAGHKLTINDATSEASGRSGSSQATNPDDWQKVKKDALPGEVLAITGNGLLVQTGKGFLILTDFAIEGEKIDSLRALVESGMPVVLG